METISPFRIQISDSELNELPQFRTRIDGTELHFVHQRRTAPRRGTVLLMHGWPDSFLRHRRVIGPLAEAGFEVVAPSLPGFGFSGHWAGPSDRTADLYARLMTDLGLPRLLAAGADLSTAVALQLGRRHPERLRGLHLLDIGYPSGERAGLGPAEQEWLARLDSLVRHRGRVRPREALLDNLSLYWSTEPEPRPPMRTRPTAGTSNQFWVDVPTAMLIAPGAPVRRRPGANGWPGWCATASRPPAGTSCRWRSRSSTPRT